MTAPLWRPSEDRVQAAAVTEFAKVLARDWGVPVPDFPGLSRLALESPERFWSTFRAWAGILGENWDGTVLEECSGMPGVQWFPEARLNYAENLLRRRDDAEALIFWGEDKVRRRLTFAELYDQVSRLRQALEGLGVHPGDRVAGVLPNMPEAVIAMLAASSLGAIWSSCSPDFGVDGVVDRFGQIAPKVLIAADGYFFKGKAQDCRDRIARASERLPSLKKIIVVPYLDAGTATDGIPGAVAWDDALPPYGAREIAFPRFHFNHPLFIMFSSGTTGVPKCITHGAGGTLLEHVKEHRLHCDLRSGDRLFYFTTCGWMMWNWMVSGLASGATLLLYDGSPFHPGPGVLFDLADAEDMTLFGTAAKYLDAIHKAGLEPARTYRLESLRTMTSTGSPLSPESFDYVYESIKADIHLASISGGTDIIGCFVLGDPTAPVWRGEIQSASLGLAVDVFDEDGIPLPRGKGELVCTRSFPSAPVGFWGDPDGGKYRKAYFERFPKVWCHGDFIERTENGGFIIHGRSDATLNPGGVRIGTAEIYRQAEQFDAVVESLAVGQDWQGDVRIVLFVVLADGATLDADLTARIKQRIRDNCSPRHVPAKVIPVAQIPRTRSGKITELAVRDVIHGRPVANVEALANPEALELYRDLPELREQGTIWTS